MSEIHFTVEWVPEGGYIAKASNSDIFTEADDLRSLAVSVRPPAPVKDERGGTDSGRLPEVWQ